MKIITLNPTDVQKHWTRKLLPPPSPERVTAIINAIQSGVKLPPGYLVAPDLLVAGETRRLACKAMQVDMDFIVITEEEAAAVALGENTNRQSYKFKFQLAFIYCPLAAQVVKTANKRKGFGFKTQSLPGEATIGLTSLDDVAESIGVSPRMMADAKKTYDDILSWDANNEPRKWGDSKVKQSAMEYWTDRIMDQENEPCGLGAARSGLAGTDAGAAGKTAPVPRQLGLFCQGLESVGKWSKCFVDFDEGERKLALRTIKKTVANMPPELREEIVAEIKRLEREQKEAAV